jgi:DNA-binding NarL/FixJ family response regulator
MRTRNSVLVVEDFKPFRVLVSNLLRNRLDFQVISEASDGFEAVRRARELSPDLILMDIGLPGLNGLEAARQIREQTPRSRIIFLSQERSAEVVEEALRAGGFGYVHKPRAGDDLFPAITAVLEDQRFVSDGLLGSKEAIIKSSDARTHQPYLQKTPPLRSLRARP